MLTLADNNENNQTNYNLETYSRLHYDNCQIELLLVKLLYIPQINSLCKKTSSSPQQFGPSQIRPVQCLSTSLWYIGECKICTEFSWKIYLYRKHKFCNKSIVMFYYKLSSVFTCQKPFYFFTHKIHSNKYICGRC